MNNDIYKSYEEIKRILATLNLSPQKYEGLIQALADALEI